MKIIEVSQPRRRGAAVALALVAIVILLATGVGLLSLGVNGRIFSTANARKIKARCAADSGLVRAIVDLNESLRTNPAGIDAVMADKLLPEKASLPSATNEELSHCDATFSYKAIQNSDWAALGTNGLTIESIGKCGSATAKVYAFAKLKGLFDSAILVQDTISLMPNTLVAGYNSADPSDTEFDLQIGTVSTSVDRIPLGPGTVIDGDVFVGVDGDPATVVGTAGMINGDKYALEKEPEFPEIVPPSLANWATSLSAAGTTVTLGPGDSGTYTGIDLSKSGILEIQGGRVELRISGDIDIGNGCELVIRPGSSLVLYVDGNINADNSVGFNNEGGHVRDFQMYATGTSEQVFNLKAKSAIFGTVYAPKVDITLYPNADIYGAIVGKNVTFKSGSTFYYDEALRDNVSAYDPGAGFIVKRWREE